MAITSAINLFVATFCEGRYRNTVKNNTAYDRSITESVTLSDTDIPTLSEGADLRIMSFNILAELWADIALKTLLERQKCVPAIILSYSPDVVGLQEVTPAWYSSLEEQLAGLYNVAGKTLNGHPDGETNFSTLMYNVATTELIECSTTVYSEGNDPKLRNLTYGLFHRKSDGAKYIVTCTHWDITVEARRIQCSEMAELVQDLVNKYRVPIFCTGDYNETENGLFRIFLDKTGMLDPKYTAKVIGYAGGTGHELKKKPTASSPCVDHIAVTTGPKLLYYNAVLCPTALEASDHCPIYIDVKL